MKYSGLIWLMILTWNLQAQQTVGLFINEEDAYEGYTLFAPIGSTDTYLINNCGEKVHSWPSTYQPGLSSYLMDNGVLLRTGRTQAMGNGIVEMIDWDGNVIWDYSSSSMYGRQHHDVELLPNGNILLIVWDERSSEELFLTGSSTAEDLINSEQIIEIEPDLINGGGNVVWQWKAWDHLIQNADSSKMNYGIVGDHPERIDINFKAHTDDDWLHFNGIDYHPEFDQIILSVHGFGEFWIIDHSTTMEQAATSSDGNYGMGGDLLYRWGNPQAYDQGAEADQQLFRQHDTQWIEDGLTDAGKILLFNNQAGELEGEDYSSIMVVDLPVDQNGFYTYGGGAYDPLAADWTYTADDRTGFYSQILSGVQRLPNGNTLICQGVGGRFFEVDALNNTVWKYINPATATGIVMQEELPINNNVFRCTRLSPDHPGLSGRSLEPQGYIESGSTFICELPTAVEENAIEVNIKIYPNPAQRAIHVHLQEESIRQVTIKNIDGKTLLTNNINSNLSDFTIDLTDLLNGLYFLEVSTEEKVITEPFLLLR